MKPPTHHSTIRNLGLGKMRRYNSRTAILAEAMAGAYIIPVATMIYLASNVSLTSMSLRELRQQDSYERPAGIVPCLTSQDFSPRLHVLLLRLRRLNEANGQSQ